MIEFCIGYFLGVAITFISILLGSLIKEDSYNEEKTKIKKGKKYKEHKS